MRCDDGSLQPQEEETVCTRAVDRLWELLRQATVDFLSAHPKASARRAGKPYVVGVKDLYEEGSP